jgi:arylsulfatase A-like enzyme
MTRAVLLALDGLRRDFVTPGQTPNLAAFRARAAFFGDHRSVFPSATRVVSSSVSTGCLPRRHGLQGNSMVLWEDGALVHHDAGHPDFLQHKRQVTGRSLAMPTLAERVAAHGGAIVMNNVSPGAAMAHDPDGHGYVYHRSGSFGPGRVPVPAGDELGITFDAAGEDAMAERFAREVVAERRPTLATLWMGEPDHIQHGVPLGSPEHLAVLREADRRAGEVIAAVDRRRATGEDILLVVCSDHGHQTVTGVVDIDRALIDGGLKDGPDSGDVITAANGTASLIYLHPDHETRREALGTFLRAQPWAGHVVAADALALVGQSPDNHLAFAVALASDGGTNEFGVSGRSFAAAPRGSKPDRLGCGQHGALGAAEQMPFLMIDGPGFEAGALRTARTSPIDIAPTILRHLGLPAGDVDGRALQL